jgi:hypothetical protein
MLTPRLSLATLAGLLGLAVTGFADTVILKSGEKMEGRILNESETEVTIEVPVTASIKDQRVIKKADVAKIEKVQPDLETWATLKNLGIAQESQDSADYQRAINLLNGFVTQYPQSAHAAEAKTKISQLQEEQKRVEAGELKLGGKWMTADEVKEERVQINGRILLGRMKAYASAGQLVEAMNAFDAIDKTANGSASFPDAIVLARQILPTLKSAAEQRKAQVKTQAEERKRRLQNVQGPERQQLETLQKQQVAQTDAMVANYEKSGAKWLPLNPANDKSLSALSSKATSELSNVGRHNIERMKASLQATERAKAAIEKSDGIAADEALKEATSAWAQNEYIKRLQPKVAEAKEKAVAAAKAEEAAKLAAANIAPAPKAKPTPGPASTATVEPEAPKKEEGSVFGKPVFWVILVLLAGLGVFLMKKMGKSGGSGEEEVDQ